MSTNLPTLTLRDESKTPSCAQKQILPSPKVAWQGRALFAVKVSLWNSPSALFFVSACRFLHTETAMQPPSLHLAFEKSLPACSHQFWFQYPSCHSTPGGVSYISWRLATPRATMAMSLTRMPWRDSEPTEYDRQVEERLYSDSSPD